jgi:hypothetical protein
MAELVRLLEDDSADPVVTEQFFTNGIRVGEEGSCWRYCKETVECFEDYVLAQEVREKRSAVSRRARLDSGEE